ncbi:hypothetical protein [Cellulophaga lytica]|uniref:hypothetical protein n=1 Tax=Cellulophaga lytica TaxID=979 RepID=UPI0012F8651B|nr:hypothetical protein [Cellulophaga lytica]
MIKDKRINVLIQKNDLKSKMWKKALSAYDINLVSMDGSPIMWIFFLLKNIVLKKPDAIIFRYLNDYKSLTKTLARFFSEFLTILFANSLGIKILWICHNIDKETDENFPRITKIRRKLLENYSDRVLVLDRLLIKEANFFFKNSTVEDISFGKIEKENMNEIHMNKIRSFINEDNTKIYGLTVGSINYKTVHFKEIPKLIDEAQKNAIDLRMVVCGPIGNYLMKNDYVLYEFFINNKDILFIDDYVRIDESMLNGVSFAFKSNVDKSVPLSYYTNASAKLPILALENTFSGKMVNEYNIGFVLKNDYSNLKKVVTNIENNNCNFDDFFKTHSWDYAAEKINNVIRC